LCDAIFIIAVQYMPLGEILQVRLSLSACDCWLDNFVDVNPGPGISDFA
jgi:hypothetical protein